ncbi:hypothetical protein [Aureibaculum luteum]|uniref:hypothetical protein n=1 Tax=Aureibaculum luteum TaxID=1548456 RepID=UPI000E468CBD|nr:hypothetical protein [Aureibaculum luteum]
MLDKYKYHHKVLNYLNDKRTEHFKHVERNKTDETEILTTYTLTPEEISNGLKIDSIKTNATLIDLHELGFVKLDNFRYSSKENAYFYIESEYFKKKHNEYITQKILTFFKDFLIISIGLVTLISLIYNVFKTSQEKVLIEKEILEPQSKVESIKQELSTEENNTEMILNDSLKRN